MKVFKKGDKVKISDGCNASDFNHIHSLPCLGVYNSNSWKDDVYEIHGELQLITFNHNPKVYGAYLLTLNGDKIGYVYNTAIKIHVVIKNKYELTEEYIYKAHPNAIDLYKDTSMLGVWFSLPCEKYRCFYPLIGQHA